MKEEDEHKNEINRSNASKILSKVENPLIDGRKVILGFEKYENID